MTSTIVVEMSKRYIPIIWIIHEWWTEDQIIEQLQLRNMNGLTLDIVNEAFNVASTIVFVSETQRRLYTHSAPSTVIFVGVPGEYLYCYIYIAIFITITLYFHLINNNIISSFAKCY
jgi:hypothetical protein